LHFPLSFVSHSSIHSAFCAEWAFFAHFFCFKMKQTAQTYRERIKELIEPFIESEGMELVELECLRMKSRWLVRVFIDKEGGVTIDDCTDISQGVGDLLDVHELPWGSYTLEVSSPGIDRLLVKDKDFEKYRGHRVKVRLAEKMDGAKNIRGRLMDVLEDGGKKILVLEEEGKTYRILREMVVRANLEYEA